MKKFFVGIDFSKRRMDVSIVEKDFPEQASAYKQFANNAEGANEMCNWICSSLVGTFLFAFLGGVALDARLAIEHGPCEASHLRRDRGVQRSSPVVYGSI